MSYIELHCHSNFSFLDGASHPEDLITRAQALEYPALALTDHNGLYGIVRFCRKAHEFGLKPIIGAEITLFTGGHLILLAQDNSGYANLSHLLSTAQLKSKKGEGRVSFDMLAANHQGLIALSGCAGGDISKALRQNDIHRTGEIASQYRELFGADNFYLELIHHNLAEHDLLCERLASLGRELSIPLVATNNVHYSEPDGRRLQDVLTCIKHHVTLDDAHDLLYPNAERYLKPPHDMIARFAKYPSAVANTEIIADRCSFSLSGLNTTLPDFPVPDAETTAGYLHKLTYDGAHRRYGVHAVSGDSAVVRQLEHELALITKLNLCGYFLIVRDIARFCGDNGILCQGRGSAANSAVCYCLGITAVDPIRLQLLFERFLSENRREAPDIDIDIANNRREEVIQYVYAKYGRQHAAMVCEVITYRGRSAMREVGKALGFSLEEVNRLAKLLDHWSDDKEVALRLKKELRNVDSRRLKLLVELCKKIHRFPRHIGIHVGGMVVTKEPLSQVVPIENATMPDRSVVQWDKDDVADAGLVKIDLLGLGMLSLIDIAFKLIKKHRGLEIDPAKLSYDDPRVYDLLCTADTVGVFQVESRAQMATLPRHQPRRFYDLVVEVALIRPGPIQGDMVHPYLRRHNGEEPVTYPHPKLEPILKRTLGIPLFQEQGMQVAMTAAGFSPGEADELRRAMGHKRSYEKMEALRQRLVMGMVRNGIDEDAAARIYHQLSAFADFGFAESHAASFALLVYVSAYLKVYYPQEFYCALLNAQPMGFYTPATIIYEARRRGVNVLGIDILKSRWDCTIENDCVRLGFRYTKSLGPAAKEHLEKELASSPFRSMSDFVFRSGLNQAALEQLALVGAFDCFGLARRQALWEVLALAKRSADELSVSSENIGKELLPDMSIGDKLAADFKGMDVSAGPHPISLIRAILTERHINSSADLRDLPDKTNVTVAGMVVIRQRPMTAKGFMFLTLEDETGFVNIVVKPNLVERFRKELIYSGALVVRGVVERQDGVINVIGQTFTPLNFSKAGIGMKSRDFR
jgi:error-prone DNA polymerase